MSTPRDTHLTVLQRAKLRILHGAVHVLRFGGFPLIRGLAWIGASVIWPLLRTRRHLAVESIKKHLAVGDKEAWRIAKASFYSNVLSFMEITLARDFAIKSNPRLKYDPLFDEMRHGHRPCVPVLGHIGAWELMAGLLGKFRPGTERIIVVRNPQSPVFRVLMGELRSVGGCRAIGHRNVAAEVGTALKKGGTAAFLVDHNTIRQEALFMSFLGETAAVNQGPALLALRTKAVVYPVFLIRVAKDSYHLICLDPLDTVTLTGSIKERVRAITEFYNKAAESMVRRYPEQWLWMHKRWKTQPNKPLPDESTASKNADQHEAKMAEGTQYPHNPYDT